ncbi:alpha-L-arabinofuranosidase B [Fischerella thermalis JSC-11]|uniref:Alpha-L-arabinofuranosidase B n=1 Tax=Fischerella thermalis JSC-11 TaxID=741277 RepID=G6FNK6_9CYAN|nr:alpha-L-arabinofuranosidase B [Fischerella thermalis JSC-11]
MKFKFLKKILSIATLGLSVCGILLTSSPVYSQTKSQFTSFSSYNFPDHYIRHKNYLGYIEPISDELGKKDATYRLIPGLANSQCNSFESVNFPGYFLRHENFRLKLARRINQKLFFLGKMLRFAMCLDSLIIMLLHLNPLIFLDTIYDTRILSCG